MVYIWLICVCVYQENVVTLQRISDKKENMSKFLTLMLAVITFAACTNSNDKMKNCENDTWDKVFPLSEKVCHKNVSFETQYGLRWLEISTRRRQMSNHKSQITNTPR